MTSKLTPDRVIGSWASTRWMTVVLFVVPGVLAVVAGGLLAAAVAPAPTEHATWAVAYLVLVWGVAQVGLGVGQGWLCASRLSTTLFVAQVIGWNLGCAAVVAGTVNGVPAVADVGAALLVVTLILFARGLTGGPARRRAGVPSWVRVSYGLLITVLLLSIPVGLILLRLRA